MSDTVEARLRLAKLTLNGFKSFADRTEFVFDDDVIGVVGPNGCGKSNIVDAIKWVLGERSSKSLRGEEMMDVIFAGSAGRKPSGMAAVTLTFENPVIDASAEMVELDLDGPGEEADDPAAGTPNGSPRPARRRRGLPIDADIVEVERRLYRDGTSQYLINGKRVRMRDIRDLFLDTGIGADSYSIIEQGKVESMLLASPKDLRTVFEEAAGIARYKQRRIEAQRKLERTEANLLLAREQLQNTERRLRLVKGQAAKARRFLELDAERRAWQAALALRQYNALRTELERVCDALAAAAHDRDQAEQRARGAEARRQEVELQRREAQDAARRAEADRARCDQALQSAQQRLEMHRRSREEALAQLEADRLRLESLQQRLAERLHEAEAAERHAEDLERLVRQAEAALEACATERAGVLERQAEVQARLDEARAAAADIGRERAAVEAARDAERRRVESMREHLARLGQRAEALRAEQSALEQQLASLTEQAQALRDRESQAEDALADLQRRSESLGADQRRVSAALGEVEQKYLRLDSRRQTLAEMIERGVGLGEAAQDVLARRDGARAAGEPSPFDGIVGPLVDLIETEAQHAPAVEAALGHLVRALVVRSAQDIPDEALLADLRGRVALVPLAGAPAPTHAIDPDLLASGGVLRLREAVRPSGAARDALGGAADPVEGLLDRLLGATLVVEDLDRALVVRAAAGPGVRVVTRAGAVVEPDGTVIAGPPTIDEGAGLIEHRAELRALRPELDSLAQRLAHLRDELTRLDEQAARMGHEQSEARARAAALHRERVATQSAVERTQGEIQRIERELTALAEESEPLGRRIEDLEERDRSLSQRWSSLGRLLEEQTAQAAALEQTLARCAGDLERTTEATAAARVEVGRLAEQLASARKELARLAAACADCEREQLGVRQHVERAKGRLDEHDRAIEASGAEIGSLRGRLEACAAALQETAGRCAELDRQAADAGEAMGRAREALRRADRAWNDAEMSRRELIVRLEALEDRTRDETGLELIAELSDYRALLAEGVVEVDQRDAVEHIETLRAEIRRLGNVNIDAIDEESNLEQRNEDLVRQVADLDQARAGLESLIERLNTASRERFGEMFERIREHFAGRDGMFRRLFGGGRAEIKLLPITRDVDGQKVETDEIDLLESGIEIFAKPPGKEPQTIRQLSGGEKTLTVVALLLAIFKTKPSCFCVLDEVDAALDDANVRRYNEVIRAFTTHSHFIVITHNKRTMQMVDRLYGITMQERGVSTRVSVRFEQVDADGTIRTQETAGGVRAGLASMRAAPPVQA